MRLPRLGMGTWHMGESRARHAEEVAALELGLDLGMRLVDTAEMYGEGGAERVVGEAIRGRRDEVFLVSKFYPHNASRRKLVAACEASLERLGTDRLDLYLLHWRGSVPLQETVDTLESLVAQGRIAAWGVSNFDTRDMEELAACKGGDRVAANQVLYHLESRAVEFELAPWCVKRGIDVMAYCPLGQGPLARHPALAGIAQGIGLTPAQLAIAWLMQREGVCAIPKASRAEHVRANAAAAGVRLDEETLRALDRAFPPPRSRQPLGII